MLLNKYPFLSSYNPWWTEGARAFASLPVFHRDVFEDLYADVVRLPQMISVTGPRRVGKTTLLRQCIQRLVEENGAEQAQRIAYFSLDDPALSLPHEDPDRFFNDLVAEFTNKAKAGTTYLFLDEIQKFPRWELYLKKFYDLHTPVRFIVSGSASAPIFRKSHESLLGRIKSFYVLPFSFRERFFFQTDGEGKDSSRDLFEYGNRLRLADQAQDILARLTETVVTLGDFTPLVEDYFYQGGFPEVWGLPDILAKQEYLYQNQIERVIFEDLLVAAEFRKPEMLRRFYLGLLTAPGRETNLTRLATDIGIGRSTIETYFPLLEATDLVWRLHKYTGGKASAKAGNFKTYLVDLAVRNAVLKLSPEQLMADHAMLGHYAENVVANHLRRWPGLVELAYFRERNDELDFIVDLGNMRLGIEVKYRTDLNMNELRKSAAIAERLGCAGFVVVSKNRPETAWIQSLASKIKLPLAVLPLADFMMLF